MGLTVAVPRDVVEQTERKTGKSRNKTSMVVEGFETSSSEDEDRKEEKQETEKGPIDGRQQIERRRSHASSNINRHL